MNTGKVIYFRKKRKPAAAYLVHIRSRDDEYCSSFHDLEDALDYIEEMEESDYQVEAYLFQNLPLDDVDLAPVEVKDD